MPSLTINEKLNMTLDEIQMEELSNENKELSQLVKELSNENKELSQLVNELSQLVKDTTDYSIISLYDWIIHIDSYGDEYIRGFKRYSYDRIFETSNIKTRIPMSNYLLVITENESLYRLPYYSSYN